MMRKFLFLAYLLFTSCAHVLSTEFSANIDSSQVIPFDEARQDTTTARSPALYKFTKDDRQLWYLASSHGTDSTSDTFKFIRHVFNLQKIDIVIVEGFETDLGINPRAISSYIFEGKKDTFYPNGESSFAIENAIIKNVPFIGGEPSDKDIYKSILEKNYSAQDVIGFNFVRRIPQLKRSGLITNLSSIEPQFSSYLKTKQKDFGIKDIKFTFEDFKNWYKNKQGKDLSLESGEKGETAPMDGPYFTQKISKVITTIRDEHILKTINGLLKKYRNVFIAYGSSHYRVEHKTLKAALGEPKEIDLRDVQ